MIIIVHRHQASSFLSEFVPRLDINASLSGHDFIVGSVDNAALALKSLLETEGLALLQVSEFVFFAAQPNRPKHLVGQKRALRHPLRGVSV